MTAEIIKPGNLKFIDVSHWDGVVDFNALKNSGVDGVFIKATEGLSTDARFADYWKAAKKAQLIRGAYHFLHASVDPIEQARHVANIVGPLDAADLGITLDWEITDGDSPAGECACASTFLATIKSLTKKTPIIYTGPSFAHDNIVGSGFGQYPLWIANYGVAAPKVPSQWKDWTFWQFSESAQVPGIKGKADESWFNGKTVDQLTQWV